MPHFRADVPLSDRLAWLGRFQRLIAAHEPALSAAIEADTGKSRYEALMTDVAPLLAACRWTRRRAARLLGERRVGGSPWWMGLLRGPMVVERRVPIGRVLLIGVWNYPVQILGIQLVQALVAGNRVVVKPSERSPKPQELLVQLALEAALPEGTVSLAPATREEGERLVRDKRFDHIVFTGSTKTGEAVAAAAAARFTPATLELSGRDSAFVLDDADPVLAAESICAAVCMNAGQTCMGPRRALVHSAVYKPFVERLSRLARRTPARQLIDEQAAANAYELVVKALEMGGRDAAAEPYGSPAPSEPVPRPIGRLWRPTAVIDCPGMATLVEGRHFGPALAVVRVERMEDALEVHERCDQHLSASIFTGTPSRARRLAVLLGATVITVNDCVAPSAHPGVSIGGRGESGLGLSRGEEGLLSMTRPVYITESRGQVRKILKEPGRPGVSMLAKMVSWSYRW